jgi:hypothetical protein
MHTYALQQRATLSSADAGFTAGIVIACFLFIATVGYIVFLLWQKSRYAIGSDAKQDPGSTSSEELSEPSLSNFNYPLNRVKRTPQTSQGGPNRSSEQISRLPASHVEQRRREHQRILLSQIQEADTTLQTLRKEIDASSGFQEIHQNDGRSIGLQELNDQLRRAQAHKAYLQAQLRSAWALGLSEDPPPAHDSDTPGINKDLGWQT